MPGLIGKGQWAVGVCLAASLLAPDGAEARYEAKMYAISVWNAGCSGSARPDWDDMVRAWYDEITQTGISLFGWCIV